MHGFMCSMVVDLVRHRHYQYGRLLVIVVHISDRRHMCNCGNNTVMPACPDSAGC